MILYSRNCPKPNQYRPDQGLFKMSGLLCVIVLVILIIVPSSSFSLINEPTKESVIFSVARFSPTLTNDIRGEIEINTNSTTATHLKINFLKQTNTRSELFSFADKPENKKSATTVDLPLNTFTETGAQSKLGSFSINANAVDSVSISKTGIYPVSIELQDAENSTLATAFSFTTYIVGATKDSQPYAEKLNIVPVLSYSQNIEEEKLFTSKNTLSNYGKQIKNEFDTVANTIDELIAVDTPKSLSINGQYLDTYDLMNNALGANRTSLINQTYSVTTEYIADTYVPLNIVELQAVDERNIFSTALSKSRTVLTDNQISAPSRTLITKSISKSTLETISGAGIDNLIVDEKTFPKDKLGFKPTKLSTQDASVSLATYNTDFLNHIDMKSSPSTQANFLNAYSSVIMLEAPSTQRALVLPLDISIMTPATVKTYLLSLRSNPLMKSITIDSMFNDILPNPKTSAKLEKSEYGFVNKNAIKKDEITEAKKYLSSIKSLYQADSLETKVASSLFYSSVASKETETLIANRNVKLKSLASSAGNYVSLPTKRTITLTSKENSIPVTIKNTSNKAITVAINLKSDKLVFTKADRFVVTLNGQNTTVQVPVKTRTSGSFPIEISMTSTDGNVLLATQTVTLRSTSFSGVGLAIMIGSFIFLLLWWTSHTRKNRKKLPGDVIELRKEKMA